MLGLFCGKMLVEIETFTSQGCFTEVSSGTLNLLHFKSVFCFLFFFLLFLSYILVSYSIFVWCYLAPYMLNPGSTMNFVTLFLTVL